MNSKKNLLPGVVSANTYPSVVEQLTTSNNSGAWTIDTTATDPNLGVTINPVPAQGIAYPYGTYTTSVNYGIAVKQSMPCKLPENVLQKMLLVGAFKSKKILYKKLKQVYNKWIETQEIEYESFPVILMACMFLLEDRLTHRLTK